MFRHVLNARILLAALGDINDRNYCGFPVVVFDRLGIAADENLGSIGLDMHPILFAAVETKVAFGVVQCPLIFARRTYGQRGHVQKLVARIAIEFKGGRVDIDEFQS